MTSFGLKPFDLKILKTVCFFEKCATNQNISFHFLNQLTLMLFILSMLTLFPPKNSLCFQHPS